MNKKNSVNLYDFDGTIYDGDSTIDFYLFCLRNNISIIKFLPIQIFYFLLYKIKLIPKKKFKEKFFIFLKEIKDLKFLINEFWNKYEKKIKCFYLNKNHAKDIIISASPEFLIQPIGKRLKVLDVIATKVTDEGKINGNNCYGEEKVTLFRAKYPDLNVNEVYTDSLSDMPIINLGRKAYIVNKYTIREYEKSIKYHKWDKLIYLIFGCYFLIPIFLLFIFWFKLYISIPCISLILYVFYKFYKNRTVLTKKEYEAIFNKRKWLILLILIIIISLLSGAGGYFYQNWDYNARNAVLNDLIKYDWPVVYNYNKLDSQLLGFSNGFLSYYFTYWLPAAGVGKIFGIQIANIALLLYQIVGLLLFFYFLSRLLNKVNIRYFFIFFAFSGMDILGRIIINIIDGGSISVLNYIGLEHIDTFGNYFCFSSFVTQVFWVFNQAIPAFIITTLMLNEKNFKNVGIFMLLLLPFAPFPSIGLLYLIIIFVLFGFECKEKFDFKRIKTLFSIQNIMCFIAIIPIILLFFLNAGNHESGLIFQKNGYDKQIIDIMIKYLVLMILEVYVYIKLIKNANNRKFLLLVAIFLSLIPFYYMGIGLDFCNRVSIPCLLIILIYTIKHLNDKNNFLINKKNISTLILIFVLLISSVTGFNEVKRSLHMTMLNKKNSNSNITDTWKTYGEIKYSGNLGFFPNFVSEKKDNFFFKYIMK